VQLLLGFENKQIDYQTMALFSTKRLGGGKHELRHRVVLAPLTRNRADASTLVPQQMCVEYYRQRASRGGLLISEAVNISPESLAYPSTPGIWSEAQVNGWKSVTDAVHAEGGVIFCQLWHTGRVAHSSYAAHSLGDSLRIPGVSSSSTQILNRKGQPGRTLGFGEVGFTEYSTPRALRDDEIPRLLGDYALAASNAKRAGFDGVELHAAHGYLIDQFLNDGVNVRSAHDSAYGGSVANRCRLLFQAVDALQAAWGTAGTVAVRLSPHLGSAPGAVTFYGCSDSNPDAVYSHAVAGLRSKRLAYLLLTEPRWSGRFDDRDAENDPSYQMPLVNGVKFRELYGRENFMIGASGFTPEAAERAVAEGTYDAIAFGRWFISNPDLPRRLRDGSPLNRYERSTFYGGDEDGYTSYPNVDGTCGDVGAYALVEQAVVGRTGGGASRL
jgi:N-ethylmaleimide reductase